MKDTEINIAIAEWRPPDYANDLKAMAESGEEIGSITEGQLPATFAAARAYGT